jgi:hypothetical protein
MLDILRVGRKTLEKGGREAEFGFRIEGQVKVRVLLVNDGKAIHLF